MSRPADGSSVLSALFRVRRRYARSVNLERDITIPGALEGYVASPLAVEAANRIFSAVCTPGSPRAWTITGVYGTGKSAFAHFLTALAAPKGDRSRAEALRVLAAADGGAALVRRLKAKLPESGFVRAVATAQREPLARTVLRALARGVELESGARPRSRASLAQDIRRAAVGRAPREGQVADFARCLADASGGLLLVIDELGKCLEHAARDLGDEDDVYLLQQLAELTAAPGAPLAVIGLLHQGFGEYGAMLPLDRRAEWIKIQGRFEDVVFAEPPEQMLRLMGSAIERQPVPGLGAAVRREASAWHATLQASGVDRYIGEVLTEDAVAHTLPLHPVTALVLPALCARYAQNDRSLFTFLASQEPHAFGRFVCERSGRPGALPLQRLDDVYDYFAGIAGQALGFRPHFQRWAEIHAVVSDARTLDPDSVAAVKVVAALNLAAAAGPLRASRSLVTAALTERPSDPSESVRWSRVLGGLVKRGLFTYSRQLDEYRLWQGSDFDVEGAIRVRAARVTLPLSGVLSAAVPLGPAVAQRHSYRTGTLRYFERRFADDPKAITQATCVQSDSDGVALYWVGRQQPSGAPATTPDGRPVVIVEATSVAALADAAVEYAALEEIARSEPHLQADGVARREVRHRLRVARTLLDRAVRDTLFEAPLRCHVAGETEVLTATQLRARLSDVCDVAYPKSPVLWNELINRRELTSQGARARRELIEAMLQRGDTERLGLEGSGPETSMYAAVLERTGIHRPAGHRWVFGAPTPDSGLATVWEAMTRFCHGATQAARGVDELFALLEAPPYGVKRGVLPVLLAAVLLADADTLTVYREGSFLPTLGAEHFEILVKHPAKFSVKHFALGGLRAEVFRDLEEVVRAPGAHAPTTRNATILGVVRPLVRFATSLPPATLKTRQLSSTALAVRDALVNAREPDTLLFSELPAACGLATVGPDEGTSQERRSAFRSALLAAFRELQTFHDRRRAECRRLLHAAFGMTANPANLRTELGRRVRALVNRPLEPRLKAFVDAARNGDLGEGEWLDALIVVIADRPLRTWSDEDAATFERQVADTARRFLNLEAVHEAAGSRGSGGRDSAEVCRLGFTGPDGADKYRVIWIPDETREVLEERALEIADLLSSLSRAERQAVIALLAAEVLDDRDQVSMSPTHAIAQHTTTHGR